MNTFEAGTIYVCIYRCRADVLMPQKFLHHPQVGTPHDQVSGEGVTQLVGIDLAQARRGGVSLYNLPHRDAGEGLTSFGKKESAHSLPCAKFGAPLREIFL